MVNEVLRGSVVLREASVGASHGLGLLAPVMCSMVDGAALGFGSIHGQWCTFHVEGGPTSTVTRCSWTTSSTASLGPVGDGAGW
jgi:hypothetical protein